MRTGLRIGPRNEFTPVPEYLEFIKRAVDSLQGAGRNRPRRSAPSGW